MSRCQIFDFRRINVQDTKNHLARVAKSEGIEAADDALHIIAQKADGALRDALSIFDRVVSFSGNKLTREAVTENLNVLDYTYYFEVTDLLLENNIPDILILFNNILSKGFDGHHFIMGLASHFRDLLVCKTPETIELLEVGQQVKKMYLDQSKKASHTFLVACIEKSNSCDLKYKSSRNQRLLVELCLMQMASITFDSENFKKKKTELTFAGINNLDIIPPSYFKIDNNKVEVHEKEIAQISESTISPIVSENSKTVQTSPKNDKRENKKIELSIKRPKKKSAFSITSVKKKKELLKIINDNKPEEAEKPNNSFTEKEFRLAWDQFTEKIDKEGKYNLLSHLTMAKPFLNGTSINLVYPNTTIKTEVERAEHEILSFIKDKLKNYDLTLEIIVNETIEKKYAYTPIEKYEKLIDKNPLLDTLRKELGLEL